MISTKTMARLSVVLLLFAACTLGLAQRAALPAGQDAGQTGRPESPSGGDPVCGPRCVQFLLKWYRDEEADLVELVREMQWPELESGCTLDALSSALRKRGIETYAMRIPPEARLQWPHPVVLHLKSHDAAEAADAAGAMGHYVLWLPSSSRAEARVWEGLSGVKTYPNRLLGERRSGAVLLTSPIAIDDPEAAVAKGNRSLAVMVALIAGGACSVWLLCRLKYVSSVLHLFPFFKETKRCGEEPAQ